MYCPVFPELPRCRPSLPCPSRPRGACSPRSEADPQACGPGYAGHLKLAITFWNDQDGGPLTFCAGLIWPHGDAKIEVGRPEPALEIRDARDASDVVSVVADTEPLAVTVVWCPLSWTTSTVQLPAVRHRSPLAAYCRRSAASCRASGELAVPFASSCASGGLAPRRGVKLRTVGAQREHCGHGSASTDQAGLGG
jgi:hypothetical protein